MLPGGETGNPAAAPPYGVLPFPLEMEDDLRTHGDNERVPMAATGWGAEFLYRTLEQVTR